MPQPSHYLVWYYLLDAPKELEAPGVYGIYATEAEADAALLKAPPQVWKDTDWDEINDQNVGAYFNVHYHVFPHYNEEISQS